MTHKPNPTDPVSAGPEAPQSVTAPLKLDPEKYRAELAEYELSPEQENELLQTLWNIMSTFVLMGWGLESTQTVLSALFKDVDAKPSSEVKQIKDVQRFNQAALNNQEKGDHHE